MNWKIIFQLSLFGLIMAFATVSLIPEIFEPAFWLVIFIFCGWVIAKTCPGKYFLHGFMVSMVNCVWITTVHVCFRETYVTHHPQTAVIPSFVPANPVLAMVVMGPLFGIMFGIILGCFSLIASKIISRKELI